ncbi:uncharacterized protein B0T23DRAFT_48089 [Neurospora hispaniola]|uniref:Uncharacterized protein n=1 Tax=Neurospora hispaniola TaxID=588809 RepID=A0AAJ0HZC1_9PEZI|nr:hypothetical protein B0T23DRAFT_48089 [Neurospora hispaniola]
MRHHLRQLVMSPCYRRYHCTGARPHTVRSNPSATLSRVVLQHGWGTVPGHGTTAAWAASCRLVISTSSSLLSVHVGANNPARPFSFLLPHFDTRLSNHKTGRVSSQVTSLRLPHDLHASSHLILETQRVGDERQQAQRTWVFVAVFFSSLLLCIFVLLAFHGLLAISHLIPMDLKGRSFVIHHHHEPYMCMCVLYI